MVSKEREKIFSMLFLFKEIYATLKSSLIYFFPPFISQVSPVQSSVQLQTNSSPFFSQAPPFLHGDSALSQ